MRDTSTLFTYDPRVVQIPSNRISQPILACSPLPTNYTKYQNRPHALNLISIANRPLAEQKVRH